MRRRTLILALTAAASLALSASEAEGRGRLFHGQLRGRCRAEACGTREAGPLRTIARWRPLRALFGPRHGCE